MLKIKKKVLSLARKKSLPIAISFAQSKNCPDTPNPKDIASCQRYVCLCLSIARYCVLHGRPADLTADVAPTLGCSDGGH